MQVTTPRSAFAGGRFGRNLGYFFLPPISTFVILSLILAFIVSTYQFRHNGRIYTGVSVWGVDLSQMTPEEAGEALRNVFPYTQEKAITFVDPTSGQRWMQTPAELGMTFDVETTVAAAMNLGRQGSPLTQLRDLFESWYYGRTLAPVLVFDEGRLDASLMALAADVNQPPVNATFGLDGQTATYTPSRLGRNLDVAEVRDRLIAPISDFRQMEVELPIRAVAPAVLDDASVATRIQQLTSEAMTFYLQTPLADIDLGDVVLPREELLRWIRVELVTAEDGTMRHQIAVDENAARHWLAPYAAQIYREPVNARYYFDDFTRELVLVAPHVNGRELDIDATIARFLEQVGTANRAVPFMLKEIVPVVNSNATAAELGITELVSEKVTWFYGSSAARKHNIARAAANFYGIVIAPGEEFSFNKYLGSISEADGYDVGLIIVGGRTIKGVGGGICQVSSTLYQAAFWAGFPITARLEHAYQVGYYNDGEGPGMDATVFSPIVDLKFINNTPHHLLIENYYSEENSALTFKFYSTSMGRTVEKEGPFFANEVPAPPASEDIWEYDEDLPPGTVEQFDWATPGSDVTVIRRVYNFNGELMYGEEIFRSHYIPWPNGFRYGPGVEPYDYSRVPRDNR